MILMRVTVNALPEKKLEVMQTLISLIEPTVKEDGCQNYNVLSDIEDDCLFSILEEWQSREHLDHHIRSYRFGVLLGLKTLLHEPLNIQILTISQSEGEEVIKHARGKKRCCIEIFK